MKKRSLVLMFLLLSVFMSCSTKTTVNEKDAISVSIFPLYDFAVHIAGNETPIVMIVPPGVEAHSFEPKYSDAVTLQNAKLTLLIGSGMEPWAEKLTDKEKTLTMSDYSVLRTVSESETGLNKDPHMWLDFENDKRMTRAIADRLSAITPQKSKEYKQRAEDYNAKLDKLDAEYRNMLANCTTRIFITGGHEAFGYLADKYNLTELSAFGIAPDSEPTLQHMSYLLESAKKNRIKTIFFESIVNPKLAGVLAEEINAKTSILLPADSIPSNDKRDFMQIMEDNLKNLKDAMECG